MKNYKLDTLCVQAGYKPKTGESRIPAISQSTTFFYGDTQAMADCFSHFRLYLKACSLNHRSRIHAFENYIVVNQNKKSITTLRKMLANYYFKTIYLPCLTEENENTVTTLAHIADAAGCDVIFYQYGENFAIHDVTYTIENPIFIKRSVKPIHQIKINTNNEQTVFLGAAFSESGQEVPETNTLIAGSYGPL